MMLRQSAAAGFIVALMALPAVAQTKPTQRPPASPPRVQAARFVIAIDGMYQASAKDFDDRAVFTLNAEQGSFSTAYDVKPGPGLDISVAARVWRRLSVGFALTGFSTEVGGAMSGSIPHPFFFNRPRTVTGDVDGMTRGEGASHLQARFLVPLSNRLQLTVFAGPSFFTVEQPIVNGLRIDETYPFDEVTFLAGNSQLMSESKVGFNTGADVSYFFLRRLGIGATVQYAGTTIEMPSGGTGTVDVKTGGIQAGGGLRLRF